ncbi:MAG: iron-sulfur cluster assembly accessory protein [Candidatus Tectomicrobia bacterium]|uniref:Iron-sulfur cluster assembly accessory protein n=1 Tax=Tectimicrobiota bacterium TaxID=2528274 RepID=A0A937W4Q6_UNCTE|nr:iron-sulfur cluster assembly accessory protein [Candidatus Tectomicrobia bacterium]
MLTVTDAAKRKVLDVLQAQGKPGDGLRLAIAGRTAAGFTYDMYFIEPEDIEPEDIVVDVGDFSVIVEAASAPQLQDVIIDYVEEFQQSGFRIGNPNSVWTDPQEMALQELLDNQINPSVGTHGGRVELVGVNDNVVYIRFTGGCQGCGMVSVTLNEGIEQAVRESFPHIRAVVDTTNHAEGMNPYYPASQP